MEPSAATLGRIVLLQSTLQVMGDDLRLGEFLTSGFVRLDGISWAGFCLDDRLLASAPSGVEAPVRCERCVGTATRPDRDRVSPCSEQPGVDCVAIRTAYRRLGWVLFGVGDAEAYGALKPYLENTVNLVALLIETRRQEAALREARDELERRVEERTAEAEAVRERLAERERFINKVVDLAPSITFITDLDAGKVVYLCRAVRHVLGREPEEVIAAGPDIFERGVHPEDRAAIARHWEQIRAATDDREPSIVEYRALHADGSWRTLQAAASVFERAPDGRVSKIVGMATDVTDQRRAEEATRRLEERLQRSQKLESLGMLAGGVAHDFNNLLTPILGFAELLMSARDDDDPEQEDLRAIREAALAGKSLTRQLLAVARKQRLTVAPLDLAEAARDGVAMVRRTVPETIDVRYDGPDEPLWIEADAAQLNQVLLNLAVNSRDAMPGGGRLTVTVRRRHSRDVSRPLPETITAESVAVVEVADSGRGMDRETLAHAFEPFFTTKGRAEGTGLGLSSVYGIVRQHGGDVWIESEPGVGTTVHLCFPALGSAPGEPAPSLEPPVGSKTPPPKSAGTALLVEDDDQVRELTRAMLERLGYVVFEASNGLYALEVVAPKAGSVDVLVTDLIMPGMSGVELHEWLDQRWPGLPTLYMTGYAARLLEEHGIEPGSRSILEKPFTYRELEERLAQARGDRRGLSGSSGRER